MFLARVNDHVSTVTLYVASDCAVFCYHRQPTLGLGIVFQVDHTKAALGEKGPMRVFLINPSDIAFGIGVITPRWLFVLAGATPARYGVPIIVDETLAALDPANIDPGDVVGIGIHTANALRGMEVGRLARKRGAWAIYGGVHANLHPQEAHELGCAHGVVKGDGDQVWKRVLADCEKGDPQPLYDGGRVAGDDLSGRRLG